MQKLQVISWFKQNFDLIEQLGQAFISTAGNVALLARLQM